MTVLQDQIRDVLNPDESVSGVVVLAETYFIEVNNTELTHRVKRLIASALNVDGN